MACESGRDSRLAKIIFPALLLTTGLGSPAHHRGPGPALGLALGLAGSPRPRLFWG